tara:strand:- start:1911 stop:2183 length:273 start_codon:yes stop_codon:yes gene_type:complete
MAKTYHWDPEKNEWLRHNRGFGFEDVIRAIEDGDLLATMQNPSPSYSNQGYYVVRLGGYAVGVPFVEQSDTVFLKTAYRSRKLNRRYLET